MTHPPEREVDDRLADWVDDRMTDRERERFLAELRVNAQLRRDLADYERTVAAVRAALQAPTSPTNLTDRVMSAIATPESGGAHSATQRRPAPFVRRPLFWSLASAAAVLVTALLVDGFSGRPTVETAAVLDAKDRGEMTDALETTKSLRDLFGSDDKQAAADPALREQVLPGKQQSTDQQPAERQVGEPVTVGAAGRPEVWSENEPADRRVALLLDSETKSQLEAEKKAPPYEVVVPAPAGAPTSAAPVAPGAERPAGGGVAADLRPAEEGVGQPRAPGEAAGSTTGTATGPGAPQPPSSPDAARQRGGAPTAPRDAPNAGADEARKSDESRVAGRRSAGAKDREILPMVVLQGDPIDAGRGGVRDEVAARAKSTAKSGDADAPSAQLDQFFAQQMGHDAPPAAAPTLPTTGSLRLRALQPPSLDAGFLEPDAVRVEPPRDGVAAIERTWLVEGSRDDVALLLRRLAVFAKKGNLMLATDETHAVSPEAVPSEAVPPEADKPVSSTGAVELERRAVGAPPTKPAAPERRVVLRFRVLRR